MNINRKKGFTLIELLVVIAIIGILSSVVLASLNSAREKSRDARRVSDIKQIQLALELFADSNSSEYPDTIAGLVTTYIGVEPKDPSTQVGYAYNNLTTTGVECAIASGVCTEYRLGATLEQAGHTALSGDDDTDGAIGTGPDGLSKTAKCRAEIGVSAADDLCYDVSP